MVSIFSILQPPFPQLCATTFQCALATAILLRYCCIDVSSGAHMWCYIRKRIKIYIAAVHIYKQGECWDERGKSPESAQGTCSVTKWQVEQQSTEKKEAWVSTLQNIPDGVDSLWHSRVQQLWSWGIRAWLRMSRFVY